MQPAALIFDRDGTLIEHVPYLSDPAQVRLLPGVREALQTAVAAGARLFLHSNQSGIGRGYFDLSAVEACNQRLIELLDMGPRPFERICIAPEEPDAPSPYRKPSPRFAREIMRDFALEPGQLCYLGDRGSDLATARAAGARGVGIASGLDDLRAELRALGLAGEFPVFDSIGAAIHYLFPQAMRHADPLTRIFSLESLLGLRAQAAAEGRRVALTNGCFDLLHRGHLTYLQQSAALGDVLIVAVNSDASVRALKGEGRPLNHEQDRAYALACLRCVDATFIFPGPRLAAEIAALKPDIYTKAGDYTLDTLDASERAALLAAGVEIRFLPFVVGHSTTAHVERLRGGS